MAPRKRKFESTEEVEAAYATPDEYETRDDARKRKQRRRQAVARFRKSLNQEPVAEGDGAQEESTATATADPGLVNQGEASASLSNVNAPATVEPAIEPQSRNVVEEQVRRPALMTSSQQVRRRVRNRDYMRARRASLTNSQRERARERNRLQQASRRETIRLGGHEEQERQRNTESRASQRAEMTEDDREFERQNNTSSRQCRRRDMTGEERELQRERVRLWRQFRQYGKGFAYHEDFDPSSVDGPDAVNGRHYVPRSKNSNSEEDEVCPYCGAWKFKTETKGSCCMVGAVRLPERRGPPMPLARLFNDAEFLRMACVYNNVFAFTSMGAKKLQVDETVAGSRGVYTFRVMGSLCHRLGSLIPPAGTTPKFAQIYMTDPNIAPRVGHRSRMTDGLDPAILTELEVMMQEHNPYAQQFLNAREIVLQRQRKAREHAQETRRLRREQEGKQEEDMHPPPVESEQDLVLRLHVREQDNPGTHNQPTASEVAAVIIDANAAEPRDIVLYTRRNGFRRIYETSEHYDPLQYPLLHPYGEQGWSYTVKYADGRVRHNKTTMSLREFVAYLLYDRDGQNSTILLGGRLSQQYCVDQWAKVEQGGARASLVYRERSNQVPNGNNRWNQRCVPSGRDSRSC